MNIEQHLAATAGKIDALILVTSSIAATSPDGPTVVALLKNRIDQLFQATEPDSNHRYMTVGMREVLQQMEQVMSVAQAANAAHKPSSIQ